ncbi:MAG: ABC transporter ATP-binding protein/permease [Planctomycetota bacterium]|nr:ABC transporter ATP-binding protein/permease [Planctomycetota bacterium]
MSTQSRPPLNNKPGVGSSPGASNAESDPSGDGFGVTNPLSAGMTGGQLLAWMFQFIRPVSGLVVMACVWVVAATAVDTFTIREAGEAINQIQHISAMEQGASRNFFHWIGSTDPSTAHLRWILSVLGLLIFSMLIVRYCKETANARMSMEMVFHIREAVYDKLQRVGFGFHDALSSGQLINRALTDLQNVRLFVQTAVLVSLDIVLSVAFNVILIWTRNKWLAVLSLIPLPIWTYYILQFSRKIQPVARRVMEAEDRNVSIITESIAGVHVIKAFATEQQEIAKYNDNCQTFKDRVLTRIRMFANFQPVIRSIAMASNLSLFLVAGILMLRGKFGPGDLLILGGAMNAILAKLQQVGTINEQYQNAMVSSRRLHEVLMAAPTVPELPAARPMPAGAGEVTFENVCFGYDPAKYVIRDISFRIKGGSVVAIVGPTGAGKTTLVNLIARFYDPQSGRILIDGIDLRDLALASLRTQVAFVFQETYLFSDTVAGNIAYGRVGISPGDVEAAARLAQAHEFIEALPKGYSTLLGERGASLSGGQRQRLAIARAIVTNPRVLILDDATASVDPETEDLIRRGMRHVMHSRTTFVIAHRISTVKSADLVVVIEQGGITQIGTHAQLMEQDGHYREIAAAQLSSDDQPLADDLLAEGSEVNP